MDSLTQIALGSAVGVAVMGRRTAVWKAALWGAVAGTLPDLDSFIDHGDAILNMTRHRAESHALFLLTLGAPVLAWIVSRVHGEAALFKRWWLALWLVLVTHPSVPAKTLPELVKWVGANPGKVTYASFSPGTPSHFLGFQLNERFKLDMVHVAYKGSAPQITDLLGGQVVLGFTQLQAALPHVQSGKLNAIAVTSRERTRFMPQVPSLAELGHPDLSATVWFGLMAPSATPKPVLDQIQAAAVKAQAAADYKTKLEAQGFDVPQESGDAFAATIATETARWAQVVKATGFRAND